MAHGDPSSELVLGIHGWSQRNGWHTWEPLIMPLGEAGFYALSVDMPGWGQSKSWGSEPLSSGQAVAAILAILDATGKRNAALMGKSWGGRVALQAALDHPLKVSKLILTAPAYNDFSRLSELVQPILLAWSEDDPVIPFEYATRFEANVPHIEVVSYPSGGHSAAQKNADDFAPRALTFLKRPI